MLSIDLLHSPTHEKIKKFDTKVLAVETYFVFSFEVRREF